VDWNDDGYLDLLVGGRDGYVRYYEGVPTDDIPILTYIGYIQANSTTIDVGSNSAPLVVDWNEDGLKDLLIGAEGNNTGTVPSLRMYINSGSTGNPVLTSYSFVDYNDTDIVEYRTSPHIADLNSDGKKDLVVGNWNGNILYYENVGTNSAPEFLTQEQLTHVGGTPINVSYSARPFMIDWDEDGVIDIVAGNYYGTALLYFGQTVGVEEGSGTVITSTFLRVAGTPTTGQFSLSLGLETGQNVVVEFYNSAGRLVHVINPGSLSAGVHQLNCDLGSQPPGIYFARCLAGGSRHVAGIVIVE